MQPSGPPHPYNTTGNWTELQEKKWQGWIMRFGNLECQQIHNFLDTRDGKQGKLTPLQKESRRAETMRIQQEIERSKMFWNAQEWQRYEAFLLGFRSDITPDVYYSRARSVYQLSLDKPPAPTNASTEMPVAPGEQAPPPGTHAASGTTGGGIHVDSQSAVSFLPHLLKILTDNPSTDIWHKFTVKTPVTDREAVIVAINWQIHPLSIVPYFFRMEDGCITFLATDCNNILLNLIQWRLRLPYTSYLDSFTEIQLALKIRFKQIHFRGVLQKIIIKRSDPAKKFVDLSYLKTMPEFQEVVYDPSDTSYILNHLVAAVPSVAPGVISLSVAGNELKSVNCLRAIYKNHTMWQSLRVLDLSCNGIRNVAELEKFSNVPLVELHLDHNPLCGRYVVASYYKRAIKAFFSQLRKLDGTYLHDTEGLPYWKQNYIHCGGSRTPDPGELADQFVEHFFTLYDAEDRASVLRGLYHRDAYFSLSCKHLEDEKTSMDARLASYKAESRNLLRKAETEQNTTALCQGAENVLAKLARLPRTQHDPYSFTVDLFYNIGSSTCLTVTGVFREPSTKVLTSPRHFMRTFVLIALESEEYQIVNDMLYVSNVTTQETLVPQ